MLAFIKERPPLVIFFLCLFVTASTLFAFSFYIRNTNDIPDSDVIYDWNHLLKHMTDLDVCLNTKHVSHTENSDNSLISFATIQTLVNVNITDFRKFSKIQGSITLEGWHSTCPKKYPGPKNLEIYFDVPKSAANVSNVDICVNLRGPSEYLPNFSEPNCLLSSDQSQGKEKISIGYLNTTRKATCDDNFCLDQTLTKISFYSQNNKLIANFLGSNEKNLIYIHLLWTSCMLIFVILIILVYGILQGGNSRLDKYIEKCTNLIQNR